MAERYRGGRVATSTVAVVEAPPEPVETIEIEVQPVVDEVVGGGAIDPLYPVALLKIAMAMRRLPANQTRLFESLLDDVLSDMVIDRDDFRAYLERNMGRLVAAVKMRGY